ncbi:MAG: GHKL domain-containing protein [Desulfobacterales bacterium]|nr:GHKL domain-containing protein [Desulfobacterales bacterium]
MNKKIFADLSIKFKFIIGIITILIIAMLSLSVVFIKQSERLLTEALEGKANLLNKNFSIVSAKSIEENSFTNLQDLITEVAAKDREIKSLVVAYPNGTVIATSDQEKYQQFSKIQNQYILQQLQKKEDWISRNKKDKLVEIVSFIYSRPDYLTASAGDSDRKFLTGNKGSLTGCIYIALDMAYLEKSILNLWSYSILITLLLIVPIIIAAYRFGISMSEPVVALAEQVRIISSGNLDKSIHSDSRDEIGHLVSDVEKMRISIKEANESLEDYARTLEQKVDKRTEELNQQNLKLEKTLDELQHSQNHLIQSEKIAALGKLVAGIAHEINTPLGAIQASIGNMTSSLHETLEQLPGLFQLFSEDQQKIFFNIISKSVQNDTVLSAREERRLKKDLVRRLNEYEIDDADFVADTMTDMGICNCIDEILTLIQHPESALILKAAYNLSALKRSSRNISTATDRASKVVFALKNYARYDHSGELVETDLTDSIETVLTLYYNQLKHGIEVIRNYEEMPKVPCYPDALNQVWTNIIHNAIQAMENKGTMKIDTCLKNGFSVVTITDSGTGIPDEIRDRIFDPFFTTKSLGEGSGLGLDIVRKIIEKHSGKIEVESEPGRTAFSVLVPVGGDTENRV